MFIALRFFVSMMALTSMALFPGEWRIITKLWVSILLLLYEAEDIIKIIKDIMKEMKGNKNVGSKS